MLEKLSAFGAKKSTVSESRSLKTMSHLEAITGPLPPSYRNLLLHFGSDIEFSSTIVFRSDMPTPWASPDGTDCIEMFYGLTSKHKFLSAAEIFDTYKERIPLDWIPIGAAPGGNQICLHTGITGSGSIGFWDHESEMQPGLTMRKSGITKISDSLETFLKSLRQTSPSAASNGDVKVDLHF